MSSDSDWDSIFTASKAAILADVQMCWHIKRTVADEKE